MTSVNLSTDALPRVQIDKNGNALGPASYILASNASLAANATTAPVVVTTSGTHGLTVQFSGSSVVLKLQTQGPDGTTWLTLKDSASADITITASGGSILFVILAGSGGAPLRLINTGTGTATALYAQVAS